MPAPPLANDFEKGVDGATVLTTDTGSPSAFTQMAGAPKYSQAQHLFGRLSMQWIGVTDDQQGIFSGLGSITTDVWTRFYLYLPALPSDNNYYPLGYRTSAVAASAFLRILADGTIQMRNAGNSLIGTAGTIPVATKQWVRIEVRVVSSTTAGQMEYRLYNNPDSTTITETNSATGAVLGANTDWIGFGTNLTGVAAGLTHYFDNVAVSTDDWIGPASGPVVSMDTSAFPKQVP